MRLCVLFNITRLLSEIKKMKNYHISFDLKAEGTLENVKNILEKCKKLGFSFEGKAYKSLSIDEALDEIVKHRHINCIIDGVAFSFYSSFMSFDVYDHAFNWKKQFLSYYVPDNIKALNLLLNMTDDFIIDSLWIGSYLQLLDYPERKNAIVVNSLVGAKRPNEDHSNYSDGNEIYVKALIHGYTFISMPDKKRDLEAYNILDEMHPENNTHELYLMVNNYVALLEITPQTVSIITQEPIKMKIVGEQQDYDRAFYTRILLNLLENIGIDEIVCTL